MSETSTPLRRLYRLHREIDELNRQLERCPRMVAAAEQTLQADQERLKEAKERHHKAQQLAKEKQEQLNRREARIADLKGKLNACSSNKEFQALKQQIEADEQANSVLTDEILELLERIDDLAAELGEAEAAVKQAEGRLDEVRRTAASEEQACSERLEAARRRVAESAEELDAELRSEYERVVALRGSEGLAQVSGTSCDACWRELTQQMLREVARGKPAVCISCGAILVGMAEE